MYVLENVRATRLMEHRNCGYTSLQELTGFFTPGVLGPGLEEVSEVREIRCKVVCVNDFFSPPGRGLLEPPSKPMDSKASVPQDCSKSQRLQLSPLPRDLLTTSLEVILTYCYFCSISNFSSSSFLSPSAMQLFSLHGWTSTNSHFCL